MHLPALQGESSFLPLLFCEARSTVNTLFILRYFDASSRSCKCPFRGLLNMPYESSRHKASSTWLFLCIAPRNLGSGEQSGLRVCCESHSTTTRQQLIHNSQLRTAVPFHQLWGLSWGQLVGKWHICATWSIFISRCLLAYNYYFPYTVDDEPYVWQIGTFHEA